MLHVQGSGCAPSDSRIMSHDARPYPTTTCIALPVVSAIVVDMPAMTMRVAVQCMLHDRGVTRCVILPAHASAGRGD